MEIDKNNIDELLIAYLLKELDKEEIVSVEQWINSSADNMTAFNQVSELWSNAEMSNLDFDNTQAWKNVANQINSKKKNINNQFFLKPWMGIAASFLVLMSAYLIFENPSISTTEYSNDSKYVMDQPLEATMIVASASQKKETMSDGSNIQLNEHSQISYNADFNKTKREVALKGEAFFNIKRNIEKPFIVHTENSKIEVLGTSFNIKNNPEDSVVTVFVKSGLVRFSYLPQDTTKLYQEIQLSAGKKVVYNKNSRKIQLTNDRAYNQIDTYWMDNKLSFEGIRLEKVVKILEIIYDVKIVLLHENLKNCQINVGFNNDNINQVMAVIASTFNIELEQGDQTYILKGNGCESN